MTPDEAVAACREAGVRLVRFLYCDNGGIVRGKLVPTEHRPQMVARDVPDKRRLPFANQTLMIVQQSSELLHD